MAPPSSSKAPQKPKEKIPYEIKNAREWDPNYKKALYEDSTEESDYAEEDDYEWDYTKGPYVSGGSQADVDVTKAINTPHTQQYDRTPNGKAQSGSRPASHKRPNNNTHANGKRPVQPRKPKRVFNYKEDNLAKAQFRKGLPHSDTFILPKDCHEIEPTRTKMYDLLEEMGVRLGSFIRPPQDIHDRELRIWGNTAQVQQTITGIQAWLSPTRVELMSRKSTARERFANEYSNIGSKYKMIQKKMLKEAAIQKFQQVPEAGKRFEFTGTFLWPMDEVRPEDILGSSLEAFDPIRFQYQCHIVFDNKEACFKIMTSDLKSVETTNSRIEGTMKEYVARCNRRIIENLVEPPNVLAIREDIKVSKSGPSFGCATAPSGIPMLTGQALDSDKCATWVKRAAEMTVKNSSRIEQALRRSILDLPFYRGQVHMRVHFGTFALTVYRSQGEEPYPFEDFVKDMAKPGTRGDMIRDLYIQKDAAAIMDTFYGADGIFQPLSNSTFSLEEVAPTFSAQFDFQEVNQPAIQLNVELETSGLDGILYEKTHALWTRADRRDNSIPLGLFMIQLDGGASWKLQASTENTIDPSRIHPRMKAFADSVKLRKLPKNKVASTGEKIFQWEKDLPGSMRPVAFQQKTSFKYRLVHNLDWTFEIARYDIYGDLKDENVPTKTCWAATMWNTEWDSTLAANAGLGIGEAANWDPDLSTFFPASEKAAVTQGIDPGVLGFLRSVQIITSFLDGIKEGPALSRS